MKNARGRGGRGSCFGGRGRRRRKEREARGEKIPLRGVVEGFSFPHKARRGPMIYECRYASFWGRTA